MSGVVNPVCRPSGPLGFYFAPATGAFDLVVIHILSDDVVAAPIV
jgi:hypothetical protein